MTTSAHGPTQRDAAATTPTPRPDSRARSEETSLETVIATVQALVGYDVDELDDADVSVVIVDVTVPGHLVQWVSPAFERLTGYTREDVVGRNCRFLQTGRTSASSLARIRAALTSGTPVRETLLNRRADGAVFWNELLLAPVHGASGLTHYLGYQADVTARVTAHAAHDRFLAAELRARGSGVGGTAEDVVESDVVIVPARPGRRGVTE